MKSQYIADLEPCDTPNYVFELTRRHFGRLGIGLLLTLRKAGSAPLARIHIAEGSVITLLTGKVELGQGSRTILTQVVAEEMRVDPARVRVVMGDTDLVPDDGGTWASLTSPQTVPVIRKAAVEARKLLHVEGDQPVPPAEWKICGTPLPSVRGRAIVTGAWKYASDFRVPNMRYAAVARAPAYRATLKSGRGVVGAVAQTPEKAAAEARAVKAEWQTEALPSKAQMFARFRESSVPPKPGEGGRYPSLIAAGDVSAALAAASRRLKAQYTVANIAHVPLEPRAAIAQWKDGKLTVWSGTQAPFLVRRELATAFRLPEAGVRVISVDPGGAFGGKQRGECELEAAALARDSEYPVKLAWTREEEFAASYCRPAGIVEMNAGLNEQARIVAWLHRNYNAGAASLRPPYALSDYSCEFHRSDSPLRQGSYRSLAGVANTFARESFMDELARQAQADPLEYRLRHIEDERLKAVVERGAQRFGWGKRSGGMACNIEKDARLALFIEMEGRRARKVVMALDAGAILNPDGLRNQAEGAIIQGLGGALFEELRFDSRRLTNTSLSAYRVPRFTDAPDIEVILIDRRDIPSAGCGEAPITVVAPAVRAALGPTPARPLRSLPLWP